MNAALLRFSVLILVAAGLRAAESPAIVAFVPAPIPAATATPAVTAAAGPLAATPAAAPAPVVAAPLSQDLLIARVAHDLASHFNVEGDLQLEMLRPWSPPDRVAKDWQVDITDYPSVASSSLLLRCRVLADGEPAGEYTLTFKAMLWRDAWAARQPVSSGDPFDAALLDVRRVDFLREREALPATVGDNTFLFARSIGAGRLLTWRDLSRRPLVRKGELVEVSATEGALLITMKAMALQSGGQGEAVLVRNPESKRDFTAFVVDENRVEVRF